MEVGDGRADVRKPTLEPQESPGVGCRFPSFEVVKGAGPSVVVMPCLLTPCFDVYWLLTGQYVSLDMRGRSLTELAWREDIELS